MIFSPNGRQRVAGGEGNGEGPPLLSFSMSGYPRPAAARSPLPAFCLLLLLTCPLAAVESTVYPSAGVDSRWLSIPSSARLAALSGAYVARGAEPGGVEINPAALAGMAGWQVLFTHNAWVEGMSLERLGLAWHQGCLGTFGATLDYLNLGQVRRVEINAAGQPFENGTLYPSSMAFGASWAGDYGPFAAGASLRGLAERVVEGQAAGFNADLGARYSFQSGWRAGASLQNVELNFSSGTLRPFRLRLGSGYTFRNARPLALDFNMDYQPNDGEPPNLRFAGEWAPYSQWILRAGYIVANDRTPRGPTVGLGWVYGQFELDYASFGAGDFGYSHLFTLRYLLAGK